MKRVGVLVAVMAVVAGACGAGDRQGAVGGAPLLTPSEAQDRDGVVAVQGFLWARPGDGQYRLCDSALESFPPQCGDPAVELAGLDVTGVAGIDFSQNVFWADGVRARGQLADGTLTIEEIELNKRDSRNGLTYRLLVPIETLSESAEFVALLTNSSSVPISVRFNSGQSADVTLLDVETGQVVYTWSASRSFDQATREETIQPGETLRFVLSGADFDLPAGVYDVQSALTSPASPGIVLGRIVVR